MWSAESNQRRTRLAARGKQELLAAAAKVVAQRGLDHTRFTDIADATATSVSTLQYLFGSREDLLIAVIEHSAQEELHRLREIAAQLADPRERLARLAALALGENDTAGESQRLWVEVSRAALRNIELRSLYLQVYEAWLGAIRDALQDGIQRNLFPQTLSPYDVAVQILALVDGLVTPLLLEHPTLDSHKVQQLASDLIEDVLKIVDPLPGIA